jgi:L-threonylcarbamoyladenylate synthase
VTARVVLADAAGIAEGARVLREGGVVAIPTDTVYGIAAARTAEGVERLFRAKERPPERRIVLLVDGPDQLASEVFLTPAASALAGLWPGALTLVLPAGPGDTLALRVPDHPVPRALARAVGPIPTTSANLSGQPEALTAEEVVATIGERIDLVIDGGASAGGVASTVVDCSSDPVTILREGGVPIATLAARLEAAGLPPPSSAGGGIVGR